MVCSQCLDYYGSFRCLLEWGIGWDLSDYRGSGTALVTAVQGPTLGASLTSVTTGTVIGTTAVTASIVYFRVGTAASTNAYFDVFLFGADIS